MISTGAWSFVSLDMAISVSSGVVAGSSCAFTGCSFQIADWHVHSIKHDVAWGNQCDLGYRGDSE
ncbi:hypothetical protein MA3A0122S_4945 [Mycobacteroides abscessus 3A-0122-S]|nr:hypothetical protein MA3A0122S_4945 [Mycobacteroides abscessus 3A-0122-S]